MASALPVVGLRVAFLSSWASWRLHLGIPCLHALAYVGVFVGVVVLLHVVGEVR